MLKKIGNKLINIFLKFMALIHIYVLFFPKYYYEDSKSQKRKIKGRAVMIANHQKWIDPVLLIAVFLSRRLRFLTAKEAFKSKSAWFIKQAGCIPIDRSKVDMDGMNQAIQLLNEDKVVVVFPEGKLNTESGIGTFRPGALLMAYQSKAPIIPVYITKKYRLFSRKRIVIGKPIQINDIFKEGISIKTLNEASAMLHDKLVELSKLINPKYTKE